MKNIVLLILFLVTSFIINIVFYYNSDNYKNFLKSIKNDETVLLWDKNTWTGWIQEPQSKNIKALIDKNKKNDVGTKNKEVVKEQKIQPKQEIKLWKNYQDILKIFSKYKLEKLDINTNLFDITNEYPDNYLEYYSRDVSLYFFPTKDYASVLEIFEVLQLELPIEVNKVDNFWENSFYINLNKEIDDSIIRMVISYKNIVFWLKIKINEYNTIKSKLETLHINK